MIQKSRTVLGPAIRLTFAAPRTIGANAVSQKKATTMANKPIVREMSIPERIDFYQTNLGLTRDGAYSRLLKAAPLSRSELSEAAVRQLMAQTGISREEATSRVLSRR